MQREVRLPVAIVALLVVWAASATTLYAYQVTRLKTVRGVYEVAYTGDVYVTDFSFTNSTHVAVKLDWRGTGSTPAVRITISGAGLTGSLSIQAGWSSPYTAYVPVSGTLAPGVITIVVETPQA